VRPRAKVAAKEEKKRRADLRGINEAIVMEEQTSNSCDTWMEWERERKGKR
jgi:hypothetical protein